MILGKPTVYNIGKITIKSLRDFILDNDITEIDSLVINQIDFDNLAIEFHSTIYNSLFSFGSFNKRRLRMENSS